MGKMCNSGSMPSWFFFESPELLSQKVVGAWVSLLPAPPLTLLTEPSSTLNSIVYSLVLFRCPGNNQRKKLQGLLQPSTNPASSTTPCGDTPIHRYRTNTANTPEAQAQQTHLQPPLSQEYLQLEGPATQRPQREHGKDRGTRDIAQPPQSHIRPLCREPRNNKGTHALSSENLLNQRRSEGPTQEEHVKKRRTQEVGANDFEMLNRNCHLEYISETQIEQGEPKSMKRSTQLLVYLSCKESKMLRVFTQHSHQFEAANVCCYPGRKLHMICTI
ncbi:uncharacterized protein [Pleurodeles waltl]|uniref:uncharacterized protein n=1 Tax=Pleurodeles waltl TaxID=8319 RepID=UPI003709921F